jgi:hypothetical protein
MQIFTFGRQREKECSIDYLHDQAQAPLIHGVVDAVHDLLEGTITEDALRPVLFHAFCEGGGGVWEQTAGWLRKLASDFPSLQSLWLEFAAHPQWKVRLRTAGCLDDMPESLAIQVGNRLKSDRSMKVRSMAEGNLELITSRRPPDKESTQGEKLDRSEAEQRWATVTGRRCPECDSPCPEYRKTCKVCGFELGRAPF